MRVSQRLDYVMRALTYLAQSETSGPIPVGEIAEKLHLPRRFLEQQMNLLAKRGVVTCRRGSGGGCELARDASEITVKDIVLAVDGHVLDVPRVKGSAVSDFWEESRVAMAKEMSRTTVADLAARQDRIQSTSPMYYI